MPRVPAFLAALLVPAVALAQPAGKVEIAPGETLTLRVGADGSATIDSRGPAGPMTDLETGSMSETKAAAIVQGVKSQPPTPHAMP